MTSQLDERPAPFRTSSPNRNESLSPRRTWMVAAVSVGVLTLAVGLVVAVARADGARSPTEKPEQADADAPEANGGVLPTHLQEFEARFEAAAFEGGVLPAHLQQFEARVEAGSSEGGES